MTKSNIWITDEYKEKIENMFNDLNVFDVDAFFQKHHFRNHDEQTEKNTQDHDITIMDKSTFETFEDHLENYFPEIKKKDDWW